MNTPEHCDCGAPAAIVGAAVRCTACPSYYTASSADAAIEAWNHLQLEIIDARLRCDCDSQSGICRGCAGG